MPPATCAKTWKMTHAALSQAIATAALILTVLLAGCQRKAHSRVRYYLDRDAIQSANRVVLLPLANETDTPGVEERLEAELLASIQRRRLFQVHEVARGPYAGQTLLDPDRQTFSKKDLVDVRKACGADAALIGLVNRCQPYPRMQVGLYLRLVDLRNGTLLWAVDHVWDVTTEHTQRRLKAFFEREMGTGTDPFAWQLATVSPQAFQKFVAWEVAGTLPTRVPRPASPQGHSRLSRTPGREPRS